VPLAPARLDALRGGKPSAAATARPAGRVELGPSWPAPWTIHPLEIAGRAQHTLAGHEPDSIENAHRRSSRSSGEQ
jgi:hypothetical protein